LNCISAAVLETEPKIVCAVRVAVGGSALIEVGGKGEAAPRSKQIPKLFSPAAFPFSADKR
jgi:hypothetical protein